MYFIELDGFGWNWLTASFICLSLINFWQYWAFALQAIKIWKNKSAKNVSNPFVTSAFFIMAASCWYGMATHQLVIAYSGGLALTGFFTMWGVWRFGHPTRNDKLVFGSCLGIVLLFLFPIDAGWIFSIFMAIGVGTTVHQLRKLLQAKSRGALRGDFLLTFVVKNALLTLFAFIAREPVYMIFLPIFLGLTTWQLWLWWRYGDAVGEKGLA